MTRNQIRQSQLVLSFGPGSMLDLPDVSVLVGGLEHWVYTGHDLTSSLVHEPRLVAKLAARFKVSDLTLRRPPQASDARSEVASHIRATRFPEWFTASIVEPTARRFFRRRLVRKSELEGKAYIHQGAKVGVVPVRFVQACVRGHLADVDWKWLLHGAGSDCTQPKWIEERGNSGDLTEVYVTCDCGKSVRMSDVAAAGAKRLGQCRGQRPWLGTNTREECEETARLLIRNATNAYFPERITVISIPQVMQASVQRVESVKPFLDSIAAERHALKYLRAQEPSKSALDGMTTEEVWATYEGLGGNAQLKKKSVKDEEYEMIASSNLENIADEPGGDFFAREMPLDRASAPWMKPVKRVVVLHRLRAVSALVGFTRFEPSGADIFGELDAGVRTAAIALDLKWLPATESRGEGIFLELEPSLVNGWLATEAVTARTTMLLAGFDKWRREHPESERNFVDTPYIMLHTLAHMLMTSIALECGYPSSSLQERIYSLRGQNNSQGAFGLLIYTAANDAEGTLGGLVQAGRSIARHLRRALEAATLCSNDPVCAQHDPATPGTDHTSGAACHGCVIVPETSCEFRNEALDRSLVVPTLEDADAALFKGLLP